MKRNVAMRLVGATILTVQNRETPTEGEWDEFLAVLADNRAELPKLRLLVVTEGGGPSTAQRRRLELALAGTRLRVAVVSDSLKVRFVASTIALFHENHRSFLMKELSEAYDHLSLSQSERRQIDVALKELKPMVQS